MIKGSTKRIGSIFLSILFIFGSLFVFSFLIEPAYEAIEGKRGEVDARFKLANEYQNSLNIAQKLLNEYQDVARFQDMISSILPPSQNLSQAVNQVVGLAQLNRLNIELVSTERQAIRRTGEKQFNAGIGVLKINARLNGDYEGFRSFLRNLETNVNLLDLTDLKIEPSPKSKAGQDNFAYVISVNTYYQAE
ncbi:hypothetical protein HYV91_02850 [Candidatus Wolfebacteria bacterium]|nr:hypothetical protein [Candidatus Wolfebacteria bacterium]